MSDDPLTLTGFYRCAYNFDPAIENTLAIKAPLHIIDVTLREGQQAAGISFSPDAEAEIARALSGAGVEIIQSGYVGRDDATTARVRAVAPEVDIAVLGVGWSPELTTEALASSVEAGATVCSILMRSSSRHLQNLGIGADDAVDAVRKATSRARDAGFERVIIAPSFTTLADFGLLERMFEAGVNEGATVVSIADSTGIARPAAIAAMVSRVRASMGTEVGIKVHMHNDYGLALANTLAAIEAGADWIDATVLGLGERAGNCPLEELVVALRGMYDIDTGIDAESLTDLCDIVARSGGFTPGPMKPVVGANVFANKLELHVKAIASDPALLEPYDPSAVGGRRTLRLGRGTGQTGVTLKAQELGVELPAELAGAVAERINAIATERGRDLEDREFAPVVAEMRLNLSDATLDLAAIFPEIEQIQDPALRRGVEETWQQLWRESSYTSLEEIPTSSRIEYPQLRHCQGILKGALALAEVWESVHGTQLDRDILIAGALLMDVSKMVETERDATGAVRQTEIGKALPHAAYGMHVAMQHGVPLPVLHVLMSHSPNGGRHPATVEARMLDWVDQADITGFGHEIWQRRVVHYQP